MRCRSLASAAALAGAIGFSTAVPVPVAGQAPGRRVPTIEAKHRDAPPTRWTPASKTPDGQPDLQGTWNFQTLTPLERPKDYADKQFLTDDEARAVEAREAFRVDEDAAPPAGNPGTYNQFWFDRGTRIVSDKGSSLIVDPADGKKPALTAEAAKLLAAQREYTRAHPADGPEDLPTYTRCLARPMPRISQAYNHGIQIVQAPGVVAIHYESMHDTRIIPLDGSSHVGSGIGQWNGDSRGRWEGNTLVIDWTNFTNKQLFEGLPQAKMRFVERLTRVNENTINDEVTVIDPTSWTKPWTYRLPWYRTGDHVYEYACHEGNYSIGNMLSGARAEERAAAEGAKKGSD
jgi:hypothetical protein